MTKKWVAAALVLCAVLGVVFCSGMLGHKPYRSLSGAGISSATVRLIPPDTTLVIEDTNALAELLQDVIIYQKDDSYTEYSGQGVIFTLTMSDGSQTSVMAYNPFLVIDGVGYRTKYEPCEALNHYANQLLSER